MYRNQEQDFVGQPGYVLVSLADLQALLASAEAKAIGGSIETVPDAAQQIVQRPKAPSNRRGAAGEVNHNATLVRDQVVAMREARELYGVPVTLLSRIARKNYCTTKDAANYRTWNGF